jgi:hypothetical protein
MAKNDKILGKWKATTVINNKFYIMQFEMGFILKEKGSLITERKDYKRKTTPEDMSNEIGQFFTKDEVKPNSSHD